MIKLLRFPYSDKFIHNNIGFLGASSGTGDTTITISSDSGIPSYPYKVMIGTFLKEDAEIVNILSTEIINSQTVATLESPLKKDHYVNDSFSSVNTSEFTVYKDIDTSDEYESGIPINPSVPNLEYVLDTDTHNESIYSKLETLDIVIDKEISTRNAPTLYATLDQAKPFISSDVSDNLSDSEILTMIASATSLIESYMGYDISYQDASDQFADAISGSSNKNYETTVLTNVRPVVEIQENPLVLYANGTETSIELSEFKVRKGCPLLHNKVFTSIGIGNSNVYSSNNSIVEVSIKYIGGLEVIPNDIIVALGMYCGAIYQSQTSFDALGAGIKKQRHYNREIQYNTANDSSSFNALLNSPTVKSANAILDNITIKYGGF